MKYLIYFCLLLSFNLLADHHEEEVISESAGATQTNRVFKCVVGYKDAIKKHEISLVKDQSEEICRKIHESGDNKETKDYLHKIWNGANFFSMFRKARNKTDKDMLDASCKAGAFMALGPIEDSLKMKKLSLSVAVHEICIGPVKEGESIRRYTLRDDKSMSEEYHMIRKNGEFIKHGSKKEFYKNGKQLSLSSNYKNGELDGERIYFEEDGTKREITAFKLGKKHGPYKRFVKGIIMEEGSHKEDKQDGLWKYYRKGKLELERTYKMGKITKSTEYNN